jgi:hypothetical protein
MNLLQLQTIRKRISLLKFYICSRNIYTVYTVLQRGESCIVLNDLKKCSFLSLQVHILKEKIFSIKYCTLTSSIAFYCQSLYFCINLLVQEK